MKHNNYYKLRSMLIQLKLQIENQIFNTYIDICMYVLRYTDSKYKVWNETFLKDIQQRKMVHNREVSTEAQSV